MSLEIGKVLNNRYRVVELLGKGGFGAVYRAWDLNLDRDCAIKENLGDSPEAERQFRREASFLVELNHPNLPRVFDSFVLEGQRQYLVMDYIGGQDLQQIMERSEKPLEFSKISPWLSQVCDALLYLHAQNPPIIHRDIKPANIRITEKEKAVLVDFGIAKLFSPDAKTTLGARAITSGFSPPEQYGSGSTDARSDIYALAATMYYLLSGKKPADSVDVLSRNAPTPAPLSSLNPVIPASIGAAIDRGMQVERQNRFQNVADFKSALFQQPVYVEKITPFGSPTVTARVQEKVVPTVRIESQPVSKKNGMKYTKFLAIGVGLILVILLCFGCLMMNPAIFNRSLAFLSAMISTSTPAAIDEPTAISSPALEKPSTGSLPTAIKPTSTEVRAETESVVVATKLAIKVCQVTDAGGIDDKSFNATAWKGIQDAIDQLGVQGKYLESQQQTDYEKNINAFIEEGCDLIVTVGFLLGDATKSAAEKNPAQKFSIVDFAYDPTIPNILGQTFSTDQAAFLAGYTAAGVTKTGKVATYGGIQIPPVTVFMDGFALGVAAYNDKHGTSVEVLGWDPATQTGLFAGNFESTDDGRTMGESLMDEGADIIMPVAGPVGFGTAVAAKERGEVYIIGVDSDWYNTAPEFKDIILTSVLKNMDITTFNAIKSVQNDTFAGGEIVGNLENGGVGLAPFRVLENLVPKSLKAELEQIKFEIKTRKRKTSV